MEALLESAPRKTIVSTRRLRVTQKRIDANRRNATRSTGPRTPQGKAKVRLNALRHGFRARDEICLAAGGEDARRCIAELVEGLSRDLQMAGREQRALAYDLAFAFWKLRRVHEISERSRWWQVRKDPTEHRKSMRFLAEMNRYEARASREMHRALDAIHRARHENERTNPLALRRGVNGRGHSEGPGRCRGRRLKPVPLHTNKNERTNPLADVSSPQAENTLRAITMRFWKRERARASCARWQK